MKQTGFTFLKDYKKEFGGSLLTGKRKSLRPLSTKHPVHLVLKSSGNRYFNPTNRVLEKLIRQQATKYKIKIHDFALNWSHIHLLISLSSRDAYKAFIRTLTALIIKYLTEKLGRNTKGLFDLRPFTRVITWGRDLKRAFVYQELNQQEALGLIKRENKETRAKKELRPHKKRIEAQAT